MAGEYNMSAQIIGAEELSKALNSASSKARDIIARALDKTALDLEKKAKEKAPHKQGTLQRSIHTEPARVVGGNIEARVGTNLEYARAQEMGTVGMVINVPNGREIKRGSGIRTRPYTFKGNIKPKFYFRDAKDDTKGELIKNLSWAAKQIVLSISGK